MKNLSNYVLIKSALATTTAGTSEIDGATIDMQGYEGVLFVAKFGTAAANNTLQAQQGADSGLSDAADLAGTSVTVGASDELVWLDLYRPEKRYVRVQAERGTSTTLDWGIALLYGPRTVPADNAVAGTIAGELTASPDEGTV
jgi:hypothetical protein